MMAMTTRSSIRVKPGRRAVGPSSSSPDAAHGFSPGGARLLRPIARPSSVLRRGPELKTRIRILMDHDDLILPRHHRMDGKRGRHLAGHSARRPARSSERPALPLPPLRPAPSAGPGVGPDGLVGRGSGAVVPAVERRSLSTSKPDRPSGLLRKAAGPTGSRLTGDRRPRPLSVGHPGQRIQLQQRVDVAGLTLFASDARPGARLTPPRERMATALPPAWPLRSPSIRRPRLSCKPDGGRPSTWSCTFLVRANGFLGMRTTVSFARRTSRS